MRRVAVAVCLPLLVAVLFGSWNAQNPNTTEDLFLDEQGESALSLLQKSARMHVEKDVDLKASKVGSPPKKRSPPVKASKVGSPQKNRYPGGGGDFGGGDFPTDFPGDFPTDFPGQFPSELPPGDFPSEFPGQFPSELPPGDFPSEFPGQFPSELPPGDFPSEFPGQFPSELPPGDFPSEFPGQFPSELPPDGFPSEFPSEFPGEFPSEFPSDFPSEFPSEFPGEMATTSTTMYSPPATTTTTTMFIPPATTTTMFIPPATTTAMMSLCEKQCAGTVCPDPAIGSNQMLSCMQACEFRMHGEPPAECGFRCDRNGQSGCSLSAFGFTANMCAYCSDWDTATQAMKQSFLSNADCLQGCAVPLAPPPTAPPVLATAPPTASPMSYCEKQCAGTVCPDPAIGSNQMLSCMQACEFRMHGEPAATCGFKCNRNGQSGCSLTDYGYTANMCAYCSDWPTSTQAMKQAFLSNADCVLGCSVDLPPPPTAPPVVNVVTDNAPGIGGWGGSCTCPNGEVYEVGDNYDYCGSLACVGGKSGTCIRHDGPWSRRKVVCG